MNNLMIAFIGEQPIPNLIPIKFKRPDKTLLVFTKLTKSKAENIKKLVESKITKIEECEVDPYDISKIYEKVKNKISNEADLIFNLTGGTKAMAFAGYSLAQQYNAPFLYLQTEGKEMKIYEYEFKKGIPSLKNTTIVSLKINIDEYLRVHIGNYNQTNFKNDFERAVYDALKSSVEELKSGVKIGGALDIDLIIRCENYVGIAELKTGKKARTKEGIDQLNTAGGREYLGTYTTKFLIVDQKWDESLSNLRELAEARNIYLIELPSYGKNKDISNRDKKHLIQTIKDKLHC